MAAVIQSRIFSFSCFPLGCELFTGNYLFYFLPSDLAQSLVLTTLLNICLSGNMFAIKDILPLNKNVTSEAEEGLRYIKS